MKAIIIFLFGVSAVSATELTCWEKYSDNKKPVVKATVLKKNTLKNLFVDESHATDGNICGTDKPISKIVGEVNPRARKYKGFYGFGYGDARWCTAELLLPGDFLEQSGYFYAAISASDSEGIGYTGHLNCRVD